MTLQQLQYVVALDTHRHFVRAAESCFVAQPTLTLQVKKLESEIGAVLFDRSQTPLVPTPIGELFIQKAREILREAHELRQLVNRDKETLDGHYRLGIIPTLAPYLLPRFLGRFKQEHPLLSLEVREMQSMQIIEALRRETLDIGILATPLNESGLREIPMFQESFYLFTSDPRHRGLSTVSEHDLPREGLWLLQQGHCFRNQVVDLCHMDNAHAIKGLRFESGSIETLKNMVRANGGYTLIPQLSYDASLDAPFVVPFEQPIPSREISLVVHKSFHRNLLLERLQKSIHETLPVEMSQSKVQRNVAWRRL